MILAAVIYKGAAELPRAGDNLIFFAGGRVRTQARFFDEGNVCGVVGDGDDS